MTLTFSEFAKLLYPYCGGKDTQADFVITLTNNFMKRPGACIGDERLNPMMNKEPRALQNYFNGSRPIPQKDARIIMGHSSKYRFVEFISSFTDNAKSCIAEKLEEKGVSSINRDNLHDRCADIFQAILVDGKYEE